ncbi:MAG: dihydroorotase [Candidatus Accumulibacter sp.]|jgi:dihydroorotase|nr:dihydroorotase [Accumulibacter sp.]
MRIENIHIRNGRVIDPRNGVDQQADVFVAHGMVRAVGQTPAGFSATREIDATGCIVCPGLVDLSARPHAPDSELAAAVAGGITALACPPDTQPPLDEPDLVETLARYSQSIGLARVFPIGALTRQLAGEKLSEMVGLARAGCIAFSQATRPIFDTQVLLRAMQYAATFGYAIRLQPQDHYLALGGVAHDGERASRLGLPGIPVCAETIAISTALHLAEETGVRLHLSKLSSAAGVALVRTARRDGVKVSCDVAIHHLHLTEDDIAYFDSLTRFDPPLRTASDRAALRAAVAEGLAMVCSDHTPISKEGKQLPFGEALPGAVGLELLLPLILRWAREDGVPLPVALARVSCDSADALGIEAGSIEAGRRADICVFDPDASWRVQAETLRSRGKNTPFLGQDMTGQVRATLVGGRVVFEA